MSEDTVQLVSNLETESFSILQPLMCLTENSSSTRIRLLESNEFCKYARTNLRVLEEKIKALTGIKSNALKIKNDLIARNKINATNLDSLFHIQSEFYNYKCEIKTEYIGVEGTMKNKKLKYDTLTASYLQKWEVVEQLYRNQPMMVKLSVIEAENEALEAELDRFKNLHKKTEYEYLESMEALHRSKTSKIIELARELRNVSMILQLDKRLREKEIQLRQLIGELEPKEINEKDKFFNPRPLKVNTDGNSKLQNSNKLTFAVDLAAFDNILVPLESLEVQNEFDSLLCSKYNSTNSDINENFDSGDEFKYEDTDVRVRSFISIRNQCYDQNISSEAQREQNPNTSHSKAGSGGIASNHANNIKLHQNEKNNQSNLISQHWVQGEINGLTTEESTETRRDSLNSNDGKNECAVENQSGLNARKKRKYIDDDSMATSNQTKNNQSNKKEISLVNVDFLPEQRENISKENTESKDKETSIPGGDATQEVSAEDLKFNEEQGEMRVSEEEETSSTNNKFNFFLRNGDTSKEKTKAAQSIFNLF